MKIEFFFEYLSSPIDGSLGVDNIEVHPCKGDLDNMEQCDENDPDITVWSVYVHYTQGGLECIADCESREEAELFQAFLLTFAKNFKK